MRTQPNPLNAFKWCAVSDPTQVHPGRLSNHQPTLPWALSGWARLLLPHWPWQRRRECQAQEEGAQRASEGQPFPFMTISFLHISHGKGEAFAVSLNLAREAARPWPSLLSPLTGTPLCQAMSL